MGVLGQCGSVLSTIFIIRILSINDTISACVFRKKGDSNVWKDILFLILFTEAVCIFLITDSGILFLSVCLKPRKRLGP